MKRRARKIKYAEQSAGELSALRQLWNVWPSLESQPEKLEWLRWAERTIAGAPSSVEQTLRRKNWCNRRKRLPQLAPCLVCAASCWNMHHVVPIYRGGSNSKANVVRLCDACHGEVHPWMREKSRKQQERIYEREKPIWASSPHQTPEHK